MTQVILLACLTDLGTWKLKKKKEAVDVYLNIVAGCVRGNMTVLSLRIVDVRMSL